MTTAINPSTSDFTAIKQRQQATWACGNYAVIGTTLQIVGETLAEAADVRAGQAVLDVAAGNGNASLAAARRHAQVTSTDYVQSLLDRGRARALAEELPVQFELADAEALPYENGSFDTVLSTFGVMFTPDHRRAAGEMLRVTRSGGRIAMANWTPAGFIGRLFKVVGAHVSPPAGVQPASLWGTEPHIVELFGAHAADIRCEHRTFTFRYRSAAHWIAVFRELYGPVHKAFGALDATGAASLERAITALLDELNVGGPDSLVVPSEYLEIVITKD
ncbi:class I SAM-dependent methyltransferase [Ideonella sp. YS5]|uniref:class I SAM-dependent methyltransferase n=1 Tax=Ideonella sp. YS5 TaxID=3453714 RepID=UPI003EEEA6B5